MEKYGFLNLQGVENSLPGPSFPLRNGQQETPAALALAFSPLEILGPLLLTLCCTMDKQISTRPPLREEVRNYLLALNALWWFSYLPPCHTLRSCLPIDFYYCFFKSAPLTLMLIIFSPRINQKIRSKHKMLRGKCSFCSPGFLILDFALPCNQGGKQMQFPFWKNTKNRCKHASDQDSSFQMSSQRRAFELWAASQKSPHPPWETSAHKPCAQSCTEWKIGVTV